MISMFPVRSSDEESGVGADHSSHRFVGDMLHILDQHYPLRMDRNPVRIDGRLDRDDIELSHGRRSSYARRHYMQSRITNQISVDLCFARITTRRFFAYEHPR